MITDRRPFRIRKSGPRWLVFAWANHRYNECASVGSFQAAVADACWRLRTTYAERLGLEET